MWTYKTNSFLLDDYSVKKKKKKHTKSEEIEFFFSNIVFFVQQSFHVNFHKAI